MPAWATILLGTALTAAPGVIGAIPHPFDTIATAFLAMGTSIYHLFQPQPGTMPK